MKLVKTKKVLLYGTLVGMLSSVAAFSQPIQAYAQTSLGVTYESYIQNTAWQNWVSNSRDRKSVV